MDESFEAVEIFEDAILEDVSVVIVEDVELRVVTVAVLGIRILDAARLDVVSRPALVSVATGLLLEFTNLNWDWLLLSSRVMSLVLDTKPGMDVTALVRF